MRSSWLVWCAPLALLACADGGPGPPAAGAGRGAVARGAADAAIDAAGPVDAAVADAPVDGTAADEQLARMSTPRSAQVIAEDQRRLAESRARFDALARQQDGSYVYVAGFDSWSGVEASTTVRVRRGVVVERRFEITRDEGRARKRLVGWTERGAKVGSHAHEAEPAMPMEQRYDACAALIDLSARVDILLVDVAFDDRGLLARCASAHKVCTDPCWQGTRLRSLTFGP